MSLKKKAKIMLTDFSKKYPACRNVFRKILLVKNQMGYFKYKRKYDIDDKTILFEVFGGRSYTCSPKAIYEQMLLMPEFKDYTFVWAFSDIEKHEIKQDERTIVVETKSKEYYKYLSIAKYWIVNSIMPEHVSKKAGQVYVQCWHGTPLKKLRYDIEATGAVLNTIKEIRKRNDIDAKKFNYFISPSKFCTEKFISAFNLKKLKKDNIIIEKGYPRNDFLFNYTDEYVKNLKEKLGIPQDKKVILYAPTFRDNQHTSGVGYTYSLNIDFDRLKEKIGKDYVVVFRTHYFVANSFDFEKYKGFIYNMSNHDDVNDCYIIADMIITDYSSVFFDYANLKRPMLFYMYDLEEYKEELRGFYFDLDILPGPIVKTQEDLENEILNISSYDERFKEKYKAFNDKFNYLDDGDSSKRVIDVLLEKSFQKKHRGLAVNIFPILYRLKNKLNVFSMCCYRMEKKYAKKKIKDKYVVINEKKHHVKMLLKKGIKLFTFKNHTYYFNIYKVSFDMKHLETCPIQNSVRFTYEFEDGDDLEVLIAYNLIYLNKCFGVTSKIYKFKDNDEIVCYFRQGKKNSLNITVRKKNVTDSYKKRMTIFFAWLLSKLMPKSNKILLYEKECKKYEESAAFLYEKLIDMGHNNAYFVLDKDSSHVRFVKDKYLKNIIWAHTFKHYLEFFRCKKFIGTESVMHVVELRVANKHVTTKLQKKKFKYVFLQHGVMYMVSLDSNNRGFFKKGNEMPLDAKIIVSSKEEAKHFVDLGGFDYDDLYITGLPFYDRTIKKDTADKITIMPTWRPWDYNMLATDYINSSYYNFVLNIYNNIPEELKDKVVLLPHPLVIDIFKNTPLGKHIPEVISYDLILEDTALLITDYSSIAYSAFYRGANVIFVWSELEECMEHYGGHLMLNDNNAFGDVIREYTDLKEVVKNNYLKEQEKVYVDKYTKIVEFHDGNNTGRLIEFLKRDKFI